MINKLETLDDEERAARLTVRDRYPLAYQDYLGNIWTDYLYNCDTHCLLIIRDGESKKDLWLRLAEKMIRGG